MLGEDVTFDPFAYAFTTSGVVTSILNFDKGYIMYNNLGGQGPVTSDPPYIKLRTTTYTKNSTNISLSIFNSTVYRSRRATQQNRIQASMLQINMQPLHDMLATGSARSDPFAPTADVQRYFETLFPELGSMAWDARYTNMVNLYFLFTDGDNNDTVAELEECVGTPGRTTRIRRPMVVPDSGVLSACV